MMEDGRWKAILRCKLFWNPRGATLKTTESSLREGHSYIPTNLSGLVANERQLLEACLRGERGAQQRLYLQHCDRVYRLMFRMVGESNADDLTQHVFVNLFQKLGKFHGRSSFSTWLYRLASNEALQFLRRRPQREPEQSLLFEPLDYRAREATDADQRELLDYALSQLEPELRAIFLLRAIEELSYFEIAMALDIAEGTVASRLNRARRYLRKSIEAAS